MHHERVNEKYGVITEYNNYVLDTIQFYRGVEWAIYKLTGIKPHRKPSPDGYAEITTDLHANAKQQCPPTPSREQIEMLKNKLRTWKNCQIQ